MRRLYLLPVILFCVVGLAACGSDDNTASSSATTAKKTTTTEAKAAGGTAVVKLTKDPKYGQILTDDEREHALPVHEGHGDDERVHGLLRPALAAGHGDGHPDG